MSLPEDDLRGSLARAASTVPNPPTGDLADQAIRQGRRVRRRQRLGGALIAAVLVAPAGAAVAYRELHRPAWRGDQVAEAPVTTRSDSGTEAPAPVFASARPDQDGRPRRQGQARVAVTLPVDVVADHHKLVTADGDAIDLSFAGLIDQAYRVTDGWLVVSQPRTAAGSSLWHVAPDGGARLVLSGTDGIALGPDGRQLAWRAGPRLFVGVMTGRTAVPKRQTVVPGTVNPVGFVGRAVLLGRGASSKYGGYDVWWPDHGGYVPTFAKAAVVVYGALADGRTVVAQMAAPADAADKTTAGETTPPSAHWCLALLDATKALIPVKMACGLGLGARSPGWVSPDGRWLVSYAGGKAVLVDLRTAFTAKVWIDEIGPPTRGGVAWLDKGTLVHGTGTGQTLTRLRLDRPPGAGPVGAERLQVPGVPPGAAVQVVPRLAA